MRQNPTVRKLGVILFSLGLSLPALAAFPGTDTYLPMVGRNPGVAPSEWYTTVWAYNPGGVAANLTFYLLERGKANTAPASFADVLQPGETKVYENAVQTMFGKKAWGAIRLVSSQKVIVNERFYNQIAGTPEEDTQGQYFAGLPASFAIGAGESTELLGVYQIVPAASSEFRYNFGVVEVTGSGCRVRVTARDALGATRGSAEYDVLARSQRQWAFKDVFPSISTENARLTLEVASGAGKVLAYGTGIASGSQDPTTYEMAFREALLASAVAHDATLAGDGSAASPLSLADGAVTLPKLGTTNAPMITAAAGGGVAVQAAASQVLATDGSTLFWQDPGGVGGLVPGGVVFGGAAGTAAQDAASLFWDDAGNHLGLGTAVPTQQLELTGNLALPATTATAGQLWLGGSRFMHAYGTNGTFLGASAGSTAATGSGNTGVGKNALAVVSIGDNNTAVGGLALSQINTGYYNTAVGYSVLDKVTTGSSNTAVGYSALTTNVSGSTNAAFGHYALRLHTGSETAAFGTYALGANTTGGSNSAFGSRALYSNSTGAANSAFGKIALYSNTTGSSNSAFGSEALYANTASSNSAFGQIALWHNTTGARNSAFGAQALSTNTTGGLNAAFGYEALRNNTEGEHNTAAGTQALRSNSTGQDNTAVGYSSLYSSSGSYNTAVGATSLLLNTTGQKNTAVGTNSLYHSITGDENSAVGAYSLQDNTSGSANTAVGYFGLAANTEGVHNTAVGSQTLRASTTGEDSTAVGFNALQGLTSGSRNLALGSGAGNPLQTGSDNIYVAAGAGASAESGTIRIGAGGSQTRAFLAGVRGVTTDLADGVPVLVDSVGQLGTFSSSARVKQDIENLGAASAALLRLRPVTFRYRASPGATHFGLIAEEVAEVIPELVVYDAQGEAETVLYHELPALLVAELQRQHREIAELRAQVELLRRQQEQESPPRAVTP